MSRPLLIALVLVVAGAMVGQISGAEITGDQVQKSIQNGAKYLLAQQKPDGSWDEQVGYPYGLSGLATLALLNAGLPPDHPQVSLALKYLRDKKPEKTYCVALQTMVLCAATPNNDLQYIRRNAKMLASAQMVGGETPGPWSYEGTGGAHFVVPPDNSNAQFALLALHEADLAGATVDPQTWRMARKYWEETQNPDGSWGYRIGQPGTGSMTCAGISSLIICQGHTSKGDAEVDGERLQCCGQQQKGDAVERGLEWLGKAFSVRSNPTASGNLFAVQGSTTWRHYYLYGLERVGRMTARRFIGQHDWYREGADVLVSEQDKQKGYWESRESRENREADNDKTVTTSMCLLFLSKGRRPVVAAKLKYGPGDDWNHHRSDLQNLTMYVEGKWHMPLTYQVFDVSKSTVDDLSQSPVLYFNGSVRPAFTREQIKSLRDYVDRGGFIFAEATCPQCAEFHQGMLELIPKMFPEPEYALRLLPPEHPIWHAEEKVDPRLHRPLYGIDYGCRTCLVYSPPPRNEDPAGNLSCYWEVGRLDRDEKRNASQKIKDETTAAFSIGNNILAYATNHEPKHKDEIPRTTIDNAKPDPTERGKLYVANVRHSGGCDVAPSAIPNLMKTAAQQLHLRVGVDPRQVVLTDEKLFDYPIIFMHGRSGFRFSKEEREQLHKYVMEGEGSVVCDAICANKAFAASFRSEMQAVFPKNLLSPIPVNHSLLTDKHGGYDLSKVKRRDPLAVGSNDPLKVKLREGPAELEGIKIGDRYAVIFSPYDLSCALEKHQSLECEGYIREDAERIALNAIVYALQEGQGKK